MSDAKKYYWLKLKNDFFKSKEIKLLRRIAGGDTYTIIYLKMLLLSLKQDGKIFYDGIADNMINEIALEIDEDDDNVKIAFSYLIQKGLATLDEQEVVSMTQIGNMIGVETDKAELMRKKRSITGKMVTMLPDVTTVLPDVTKCYTEKEKEKEIEIEIDKERDKGIDDNQTNVVRLIDKAALKMAKQNPMDFKQITDLYHSSCSKLPKIKTLSDNRKKTLRIWGNMAEMKEVFEKAGKSDFLTGVNNNSWAANFDWIIKPENRIKILEGNYDNKRGVKNGEKKTAFNNYDQRDYDFADMERKILEGK